jgi:hypothetical protein
MKAAFTHSGLGSRTFLGIHLAYIKLSQTAAKFSVFVVALALFLNDDMMSVLHYVLIGSKGAKYEAVV